MARSAFRLPGYRVEQLIGAGSSGEVWRATVVASGVPVALKRVRLSSEAQRAAAVCEAAVLSALDHAHLMRVHEVRRLGEDEAVLVLDLAGGGSLAALLRRRGRLTLGETITALAPVAAALAYAHQAGVVHGDVAPANILFTDAGLPLLADLGVARVLGNGGAVRTTPAYADPAVAAGAIPEPVSDVFMLAGVALHALTGTPPWSGSDPAEIFGSAARGDRPDFAGRLERAGVPAPARAVVLRGLSLEPARRGSAAEFALDLRHAGEPVAVELAAGRTRAAPSLRALVRPGRTEARPAAPRTHPAPEATAAPGTGAATAAPGAGEADPTDDTPFTYGVRPPDPFPPAAPRHSGPRGRLRLAPGLVAAVLVVGLAVATGAWWWLGRPGRSAGSGGPGVIAGAPAAGERPTPSRAPGVPAVSAPPSAAPAPAASGPPADPLVPPASQGPASAAQRAGALTLDAAGAAAVLARLDALRAQAYARRDGAGLAEVYASPALLGRDRAQLFALVPAGCGLHGVRTRFADPVVLARTDARVRLRVGVQLHPSTLVCGAAAPVGVAGTGPELMQLELSWSGSAYLITDQRRG